MAVSRLFTARFNIDYMHCLPYSGNIVVLNSRRNKLAIFHPETYALLANHSFNTSIEKVDEHQDGTIFCTLLENDQTMLLTLDAAQKKLTEAKEQAPFVMLCGYDATHYLGTFSDDKSHQVNLYQLENKKFKHVTTLRETKNDDDADVEQVLVTAAKKIKVAKSDGSLELFERKENSGAEFKRVDVASPIKSRNAFTMRLLELGDGVILKYYQNPKNTLMILSDAKTNQTRSLTRKDGLPTDCMRKFLVSPNGETVFSFVKNEKNVFVLDVVSLKISSFETQSPVKDITLSADQLLVATTDGVHPYECEDEQYQKRRTAAGEDIFATIQNRHLTLLILRYTFFYRTPTAVDQDIVFSPASEGLGLGGESSNRSDFHV